MYYFICKLLLNILVITCKNLAIVKKYIAYLMHVL